MPGHKVGLGKFKKVEITLSIFFYHNAIRLEINYKEKNYKYINRWQLNNMLVNNQWIMKKSKRKLKNNT